MYLYEILGFLTLWITRRKLYHFSQLTLYSHYHNRCEKSFECWFTEIASQTETILDIAGRWKKSKANCIVVFVSSRYAPGPYGRTGSATKQSYRVSLCCLIAEHKYRELMRVYFI